nr:2-oxoglutarate and iron-dependent oxygenase domain-containing protein [Streptomyces sp. HNM0575]
MADHRRGRAALPSPAPLRNPRRPVVSSLQDFSAVPVVDISGLRLGTPREASAVADRLGRAAREVGFMYVAGHGVEPALFERLLTVTKEFFALSHEEKMRNYIGLSRNHRGYVPEGEEVFAGGTPDRKEAFDLSAELPADDPDFRAGNPLLGPNQWPDSPDFRTAVTAWYDTVAALGRTLFRGFAIALGEPADAFEPHLTKPPSQLRLIHYPYDADAADRPGIGAHTDYECFTLLRPTAPGLEVLNGAGRWIDAPPVGDTFVVNIGDMLELWSNGEFTATTHRVRKVAEERWSFPLFCSLDYATPVRPLPRFVTAARPARPGLVAGEHLFAQTAQTFGYLRRRIAAGEVRLPDGSLALSSFGHSETGS